MDIKKELLKNLETVEVLSNTSKLNRLAYHPFKYVYAIGLKSFLYPIFQKEKQVTCKLFMGEKVKVILPAATDIYLTGGKTHNSEIRLAKFLIKNLNNNDKFWDLGAHYGYFSILSSRLVGEGGNVVSIEAAPSSFKILNTNTHAFKNIQILNNVMSDKMEQVSFYELPNIYSEYNTTDVKQFAQEKWFSKIKPQQMEITSTTLDSLFHQLKQLPDVIKIDVEGGEYKVINGGLNLFKNEIKSPVVIMEYLAPERNNQPHIKAADTLRNLGYKAYAIQRDGTLILINNIEEHFLRNNLESDNIVFKRSFIKK